MNATHIAIHMLKQSKFKNKKGDCNCTTISIILICTIAYNAFKEDPGINMRGHQQLSHQKSLTLCVNVALILLHASCNIHINANKLL